jgi:hypothetical protein
MGMEGWWWRRVRIMARIVEPVVRMSSMMRMGVEGVIGVRVEGGAGAVGMAVGERW